MGRDWEVLRISVDFDFVVISVFVVDVYFLGPSLN